jgi:hypothetical protein
LLHWTHAAAPAMRSAGATRMALAPQIPCTLRKESTAPLRRRAALAGLLARTSMELRLIDRTVVPRALALVKQRGLQRPSAGSVLGGAMRLVPASLDAAAQGAGCMRCPPFQATPRALPDAPLRGTVVLPGPQQRPTKVASVLRCHNTKSRPFSTMDHHFRYQFGAFCSVSAKRSGPGWSPWYLPCCEDTVGRPGAPTM